MKKKTVIFLSLIIAVVCCLALPGCFSAVLYEYAGEENGVSFYANKYTKQAFARPLAWDGDENSMVYTVPDTFNGYKVTQLGGNHGSGGISYFVVNLPAVYDGLESVTFFTNTPEEMTEENSEELVFTVNIGQNISTLERGNIVSYCGYGEAATRTIEKYYIVKLYFNCDSGNSTFYSRDGVLYYKSNDQKAEFKY